MKFIKNNFDNEEGIVLISSMLFLMIVTILAVSSLQSPKVEKLASSNERFVNYAQELANMGVLEAKNWLLVNHRDNILPSNYDNGYIKVIEDYLDTNNDKEGWGETNLSNKGSYKWGITRLSLVESRVNDVVSDLGASDYTQGILNNYSTPGTVNEGWDPALDQDRAILNYYYIISRGSTLGNKPVKAYSEAVVGYIQVIPSLN